MTTSPAAPSIAAILKERILVMDGAMGTAIQELRLANPTSEASDSKTRPAI